MGFSEEMRNRSLSFYEEEMRDIDAILDDFVEVSKSKCALLIDKDGHLVTQKGIIKNLDTTSIAALVAGSFASTAQLAKLLGETEFSVLFHQGANDSMHISLVADRCLTVIIFDDRTTIGMVRLYAKQLSDKLTECLIRAEERIKKEGGPKLEEGFQDSAADALDNMFGDD